MQNLLNEMGKFVMSKVPVINCKPDPYIVCTAIDESFMDKFVEDRGVMMSMSYLKCAYVMSLPTSFGNKAVSNEFLTKHEHKTSSAVREGDVKDILAARDSEWDVNAAA